MSRVLVLQPAADDPSGYLGAGLAAAEHEVDEVHCYRGESQPESLAGYGGLVVLGGSMGAYDDADHPWLSQTKKLLAEAVSTDLHTLAICLGHQLLCVAAGGRVATAAKPQQGLLEVDLTDAGRSDDLFGPLSGLAHAVHWNNDLVVETPPGAAVLARTAQGVQAVRLGRRVYGVQFHPEVDLQTLASWAESDVAAGLLAPEQARVTVQAVADRPDLPQLWRTFADRFAQQLGR